MPNTQIPQETPLVEWKAMRQLQQKRGKLWYAIAAIFVAMCLIYSFMTGGWTFSILIVILSGIYWKLHSVQPMESRIRIWRQCFAIDDECTEWGDCIGYWMLRGNGFNSLHIAKRSGKEIRMLMGNINPHDMNELLPHLLPHLEDRREGVLDTIIRICKL